MDFDLSPEQEQLRDTVRAFAEREVGPLMAVAEEEERFPTQLFRRLGELDLLCITFPPEFGAAGLDRVSECVVIEELGRISAACAGAVMVHGGLATSAIRSHGNDALKRRLLPAAVRGEKIAAFALTEADAGSDAAAIRTRARRHDGGFVLNGTKVFITNAGIADLVTVAAVTDEQAAKGRGISLFVVERGISGLEVGRHYDKVGHRGADTAELVLRDCWVPDGNLIGAENAGFAYLAEALTSGRVLHAARSLGVARAAFEMALQYSRERQAFGKPIGSFQSIAFKLSTMSAQIESTRWLVYHAAWLIDRCRPCAREAAIAKLVASEAAESITSVAMHIFGGLGYMREAGVERLWRDAKLFPITEGSSEIQQLIIARQLGLKL